MEISTVVTVAVGVATISIATASAIIGGVTVVWKMTSRFVTLSQCSNHIVQCRELRSSNRRSSDMHVGAIERELFQLRETMQAQHRKTEASNQIQYYMLRSLISHAPNLTPEQREKILNAGNGGGNDL